MNHHSHDHDHDYKGGTLNRLGWSLGITTVVMLVELVGGWLSGSIALMSDAGHMFTDFIALSLSYYGVRQAQRPASHKMTFGYDRIGVIIAIVNAVTRALSY